MRYQESVDRRTLWQKALDWFAPRYQFGVDQSDGIETTVKILRRRDGVLEVVSIEHEPYRE